VGAFTVGTTLAAKTLLMNERFYSFNSYLRQTFGERVHRISLDAGFHCPNRDGTLSDEGCIYCNNKGFSPWTGSPKKVEEQIKESISYYGRRFQARKFLAYYQAFTNTYARAQELRNAYGIIRKFPEIVGLFISTRPDCVDEEKMEVIADFARDYLVWIEYGLQTTQNQLLRTLNRNHTYEDFLRALELTRKYKINVGAHIILGLPGEDFEDIMTDARRLGRLDIQGVKFHVLHVLADTKLAAMHRENRIKLFTQEEYVKAVCGFLEYLPSTCVVLRLVSTASSRYLIAPEWINRKAEVIQAIQKELEQRGTYQGYRHEDIAHARA
jgi:hypothetical protein